MQLAFSIYMDYEAKGPESKIRKNLIWIMYGNSCKNGVWHVKVHK